MEPVDGPRSVFNLTVAGTPEFFANGALVHNCRALAYWCVDRYPPIGDQPDGGGHRAEAEEPELAPLERRRRSRREAATPGYGSSL